MNDAEINIIKTMLDLNEYLIIWSPDPNTAKRVRGIKRLKDELDEECAIFNDGYAVLNNCEFSHFIYGNRFSQKNLKG
jgi:hypothetical protein